MKILHLTLEFPPDIGGIATYVAEFAHHTPPDETVVYAPFSKASTTFDEKQQFTLYRRKPYWLLWPHWLPMIFQLRKIVKKEQITQLYVHQVLPGGYVAWCLKKMLNVPYVIFLHGTDLERALSKSFKKKRLVQVLKSADRVVVNSQFLATRLTSAVTVSCPVTVLSPAPADVFFMSVAPDELHKVRAQLALTGKKVLLTVGRVVPGKGFARLARLLPKIVEHIPDLVWVAVGDGPEQSKVLERVTRANVQHVCRFLGKIPLSTLPPLYQVADVFVLLSGDDDQSSEGWGTVFMEAAASGLPVVAGNVGGAPEAVLNEKTGLLVNPMNDDEVLAALVRLLKNPAEAKQLGAAAKARAQNEFTWRKQLKKFSRAV